MRVQQPKAGGEMFEEFLLPETTVREAGGGSAVCVDPNAGPLVLTLNITRTVEREGLDVSIWGSPDGSSWGKEPLLKLPRKYYCGTYRNFFDFSQHREIRFLRAKWR